MAYANLPGPRIAWHEDGSSVWRDSTEITGATKAQMNDDVTLPNLGGRQTFGVAFPVKRDIVGACFGQGSATTNATVSTSVDTTTGQDGTWVQQTTTFQMARPSTHDQARQNIRSVSYLGIRGIRFVCNSIGGDVVMKGPHLYGGVTAAETRFLMLTTDAGVEDDGTLFEFGDDFRNTVETLTFKVKNGHGTLTANSIVVGPFTLVAANKSPSYVDDYTVSSNGTDFFSSVNIGDLAPGVSSGTLHLRRTTAADSGLGLEVGYVPAVAGSWT